MARHKHPTKTTTKTKTKRKIKHRVADGSRRPPEPVWTDLEQGFFASAPPDEPQPSAEPERFDDLVATAPTGRRFTEVLARLIAALSAPRIDLRVVTIGIASVMLLIGLSAVVFASWH